MPLLVEYLTEVFPQAVPEEKPYGLNCYDRAIEFHPFSIRILYDSTQARADGLHAGRCCVCVPGSALDSLSAEQLLGLLHTFCNRFWFLGTRVDVAFDDYRRSIAPYVIAQEAEQDKFTGYKLWEQRRPRRLNGVVDGDMVTFGRRGKDGSGRFLRVYDKAIESRGEKNCVRWEVEFSKERARDVAFKLSQCSAVGELAGVIGALVGGSIDFVERHGKNLDRSTRLEWWAALVERLGRVKLRNPTKVLSVEKAKTWVEKSVCATLGMLKLAVGDAAFGQWIAGVCSDGESRVTARQHGALEVFWREGWDTWSTSGAPAVPG